jgi:AcrR family transcriptional regulator
MVNEGVKVQNIELALTKAAELVLGCGIEGTTKEMIARESGLSRKSIDRYFSDKPKCMLQVAKLIGKSVWQSINEQYLDMMTSKGKYTGASLLEMYMDAVKSVFMRRTSLFVFYMELMIYSYRHSDDFQRDYAELTDSIGCRRLVESIFLVGEQDGSLRKQADAKTQAEYFSRSYFSFLSNMAIDYKERTESALLQIDLYIGRAMNLYKNEP